MPWTTAKGIISGEAPITSFKLSEIGNLKYCF